MEWFEKLIQVLRFSSSLDPTSIDVPFSLEASFDFLPLDDLGFGLSMSIASHSSSASTVTFSSSVDLDLVE